MPAAALRDRRGSSRSRAKPASDQARPRVSRPIAPAPSKLQAAHRVGLRARPAAAAAALLATLILVAALATGGRGAWVGDTGERLAARVADLAGQAPGLLQGRFASLGFRVSEVHLQGATRASQNEIVRAAAIRPGAPILGLDLPAIRARVEQVAWVEKARIIRLLPDTMVIAVEERPLMAVWQHHGRLDMIANDGRVASNVDPSHFPGLPRVIGEGANTEASSLLPALETRPRLVARLRAIRRVDQRRWDLLLKDGGVVQLPATDEAAALGRLDRLDEAARILDLGFSRVDLRNARFTVVRPRPSAALPPTSANGSPAVQ